MSAAPTSLGSKAERGTMKEQAVNIIAVTAITMGDMSIPIRIPTDTAPRGRG